jgi:hypothetical protein
MASMRRTRLVLVLAAMGLVGAIVAVGCIEDGAYFYSCDHPDVNHIGPDGMPDPCHYEDDAGADADAADSLPIDSGDGGGGEDAGDGG